MDVIVIEFDGGIDGFPLLIQTVDNLVADGCRHLVIDLAPLPFINSAALGYLIKVAKTLEACGGALALARVQPAIENVIHLTNLTWMFPNHATVDDAVRALGGDPHDPARTGVQRKAVGSVEKRPHPR
jgi:anti-sigma B factor antagonist